MLTEEAPLWMRVSGHSKVAHFEDHEPDPDDVSSYSVVRLATILGDEPRCAKPPFAEHKLLDVPAASSRHPRGCLVQTVLRHEVAAADTRWW